MYSFEQQRRTYRASYAAYRNPMPEQIAIEVTPKCNQDCYFCYNRKSFFETTREVGMMKKEVIMSILDEMARLSIPSVRFTGGEPLLRSDIFELMNYAKEKGLRVFLNTNATLVATEDRARELAKVVDSVLVSLITYDAKKEEEVTKMKNSMGLRLRGVDLLLKAGVAVRLGSIATPDNVAHFEQLRDIVRAHGVKVWEIFRPVAKSGEEHELTRRMARDLIQKVISSDGKDDIAIRIAITFPFCVSCPKEVEKIALGRVQEYGHTRLVVDPRGFVKPSYANDTNLGPPSDLLSAWNHPFAKQLREDGFLPEPCKRCPFKGPCGGGNRDIAFLEYGSYNAKDPLMPFPIVPPKSL